MSVDRRGAMVEPAHHRLSISAQCRLVRISRSSYCYAPVPETDETLALMTVFDETFMECPWYGSREMARHLRRAGNEVGRRRARRLMAKMGLTMIYQRPRTSDPPPVESDLSVPVAQAGNRAAQPRVERRRDLHPDASRLPIPGGDHGLGNAQGARLATIEHDGCRVLRRGAGGGLGSVRQARDLQHGPRQPVHVASLHQRAERCRGPHQHGRPGPVDGQRVHRGLWRSL